MDPLEKCSQLFQKRAKTTADYASVNFEIGGVVDEALKSGISIRDIAQALHSGRVYVSEGFLGDALRVYQSVGSPATLNMIKRNLKGQMSWGFLVHHCAKFPAGDSEEARLYWEKKLSSIERALSELNELPCDLKNMPDDIRRQAEGLLGISNFSILEGDFKVAHIADIHMHEGFTVAGRYEIEPETGKNVRLLDIHKCLSFAVDKAIEEGCRLALITEPFETCRPTPNEQGFFQVEVKRLAEYMPVIVEPGNHGKSQKVKDATAIEFLKGRKNIYVVEKPATFYQEGFEINKTPSDLWPQKNCAKIFVLPFPDKNLTNGESNGKSIEALNKAVSLRLRYILELFRAEIDDRVPNILLIHCTIEGAKGAESAEMLKFDPFVHPDWLLGFDYVAAGHIHYYQKLSDSVCYAGSIDRFDFNDEGVDKGFVIATFKDRIPEIEFIQTPAREFKTLSPEFFESEAWQEQLEKRCIYRVKGEVTKEEYEKLKAMLNESPMPILNKLTVKRVVRVRDEKMTEELKEEDAVIRYLRSTAENEETIKLCLQAHGELAG